MTSGRTHLSGTERPPAPPVHTDEIEIPAANAARLKTRKGVLGVTTRGPRVFLAIGPDMTDKGREALKKESAP